MAVTLLVLIVCFYGSVKCADGTISKPNYPSLQQLDRDRYVDQKFEILERLLLQRGDRISELEAKLASHVTEYSNYVTNNAIEMELMKSTQVQLQQDITHKDQLLQKLRKQVVQLEIIISNNENSKEEIPHSADGDVIPNVKTTAEPLNSSTHNTKRFVATRSFDEVMNDNFEPNSTTDNDFVVQSRNVAKRDYTSNRNIASNGVKTMSVVQNADKTVKSMSYKAFGLNGEQRVDKRGTGRVRVAPIPVTNVAFHAEMTVTGTVVKGSILVYNHEVLDHGDGYSPSDGMYLVPESGTYVITWTTVTYHDYVQTLLVVNGAIRGSSMTDAQEVTDMHQTTMIVVLSLNQGDHVFIRAGSLGNGSLHATGGSSRPTFSGWKLFGS